MRSIVVALLFAITPGCGSPPPPAANTDSRPELLRALDGQWTMTGDVMGKPVVYDMLAGPTLAGAFTEIHMIDAKQPPEYEARVFIGYDDESDSIIAHWMDSFGARYSIPHGTGTLTADTIRFVVPYADGPFRDTLIYDEKGGAWQFVIEASQGDGSWKHFARYSVQPTDGRR